MSFSQRSQLLSDRNPVAYLSMEIAITPAMPTYSGGLGVLAGDTLRAAADMGLNLVAVTLIHRCGYFQQHLDADGAHAKPEDNPNAKLFEVRVTR